MKLQYISCPDGCTNGEVHLLNGNTPNEGRVEVCYDGIWGTVNSFQWTDQDAKVVCSQLGYFPYRRFYSLHTMLISFNLFSRSS